MWEIFVEGMPPRDVHKIDSNLARPTFHLLIDALRVQSQTYFILEENPNSRCIFNLYNFRFSLFSVWKTNKSWLKLKAELNDQLSDRQSCRQDSSELTRANTKLFHYVTAIIKQKQKTAIIKHMNKQKQKTEKNKQLNNHHQKYEQAGKIVYLTPPRVIQSNLI